MTAITEFKGEYAFLSNFYSSLITIGGKTFLTVEHAYQTGKNGSPMWQSICTSRAYTPGKVKQLSRTITLRPDWEDIKLEHMEACLREKFKNEELRLKLLSTGNTPLYEGNNWGDIYWGCTLPDLVGENMLGKLLMHLRNAAR